LEEEEESWGVLLWFFFPFLSDVLSRKENKTLSFCNTCADDLCQLGNSFAKQPKPDSHERFPL